MANNPQLIKAHLLLALIYIKQDELTRARKLLNAVLAIDKNNTLAQMYKQEIDERIAIKKAESSSAFLPKRKEKISIKSLLAAMMLFFQDHLIKNQVMEQLQ